METRTISKTHISQRAATKANPYLVSAIIQLKNTNTRVAQLLSFPRKKWASVNLSDLDKVVKDGEKVFVAGKVLSSGDLTKKIKIISWSASEKAIEKIKAAKSEFITLQEELKTNKDLRGVRII
ncbi:50S ribosomal protein L18e [Candidatus Pacearchaeota archaeon]|nr:50S ribosomal protein L18e [Candidatus Pacearchaeota archaeon]